MQVQTVFKKNDVDFYKVSYGETLNLDFDVPLYTTKNVMVEMKPTSVLNINVNLANPSNIKIYIQKDTGGTITVNGTSIDTSASFIEISGSNLEILQYREELIEA